MAVIASAWDKLKQFYSMKNDSGEMSYSRIDWVVPSLETLGTFYSPAVYNANRGVKSTGGTSFTGAPIEKTDFADYWGNSSMGFRAWKIQIGSVFSGSYCGLDTTRRSFFPRGNGGRMDWYRSDGSKPLSVGWLFNLADQLWHQQYSGTTETVYKNTAAVGSSPTTVINNTYSIRLFTGYLEGTGYLYLGEALTTAQIQSMIDATVYTIPGYEFVPTDYPYLECWYDGTDVTSMTLDGSDGVIVWDDKSGQNHHLTPYDTGQEPLYVASAINGKSAVYFDGTKRLQASVLPT